MFKKIFCIPKKLFLLNFALIIISVIFSYYNGFSWIGDSLSSIGTFSDFFNFSLIISGISLGVFTISVVEKDRIAFLTRTFLLISSISLVFIGIFTKDHLIHLIFAVVLFAVFPFGLLFLGISLKNNNKKLGLFTKITSLFLIVLWIIFVVVWRFIYPLGLAIPEMISLCVWIIWSIVFIKYFKINTNEN